MLRPDMLALPSGDREKLVKVLGMTGSDHPGEVVAAVTAARRILTANGLQWHDVIVSPQAASHSRHRPADDRAQDDIAWCLDHGDDVLTSWDRNFLLSLQGFRAHSDKQRAVLDRIVAKCRRARGR